MTVLQGLPPLPLFVLPMRQKSFFIAQKRDLCRFFIAELPFLWAKPIAVLEAAVPSRIISLAKNVLGYRALDQHAPLQAMVVLGFSFLGYAFVFCYQPLVLRMLLIRSLDFFSTRIILSAWALWILSVSTDISAGFSSRSMAPSFIAEMPFSTVA